MSAVLSRYIWRYSQNIWRDSACCYFFSRPGGAVGSQGCDCSACAHRRAAWPPRSRPRTGCAGRCAVTVAGWCESPNALPTPTIGTDRDAVLPRLQQQQLVVDPRRRQLPGTACARRLSRHVALRSHPRPDLRGRGPMWSPRAERPHRSEVCIDDLVARVGSRLPIFLARPAAHVSQQRYRQISSEYERRVDPRPTR